METLSFSLDYSENGHHSGEPGLKETEHSSYTKAGLGWLEEQDEETGYTKKKAMMKASPKFPD